MNFGKLFGASALALGLSVGSAHSAEFNSAFYHCVSTEEVVFDGSIVDAALETPELSTLVTALDAAGLVETLDTIEYATVYAPVDSAFAAVPAPVLDAILADVDVLTAVLTYHVTTQPSWYADPRRSSLRAPTVISTLQGQKLFATFSRGKPMVNQAAADCTAVTTDNGVVWLIDSVLLPQF